MDTNNLPEPSEIVVPKLDVLSYSTISETQYGPVVALTVDEWMITVEGKGVWYAKVDEGTWDCIEEDGEPFMNTPNFDEILEAIMFVANK